MSFKSLLDKVTSFSPVEDEYQINATQSHLSRIGNSYSKSFRSQSLNDSELDEKNKKSIEDCQH